MFSAGSLTAVVALLSLVVWSDAAHVPAGKINSVTGQEKGANEIRGQSSSSVPVLLAREALFCCVLNYTVVAGDTCSSIATSHTIVLSLLQSLNSANCTDPDEASLTVGGQLCLEGFPTSPACTKQQSVASGDSCSSIAQANQLTLAQLQDLNPFLGNDGLTCPTIFPAEVLCVAGTPQACPGAAPNSSPAALTTTTTTTTSTSTSEPGALTGVASSSTTTDVAAAADTPCTSSTTQPLQPPSGIAFFAFDVSLN